MDPKEFRKNKITVYSADGKTVIKTYEGGIHTFFGDYEKEGCVHFVDENGKHHRVYGFNVCIDEL